jgi:hypothetical protein
MARSPVTAWCPLGTLGFLPGEEAPRVLRKGMDDDPRSDPVAPARREVSRAAAVLVDIGLRLVQRRPDEEGSNADRCLREGFD